MRWRRPPRPRASRWRAVRCGAFCWPRGALAADAAVGDEHRSGLCPKRTQIVTLYTDPPEGATILCVDELGPVTPRTFPPAPGWSGGWPPHQGPAYLQPRLRQSLGLWRAARPRWAGPHPDRARAQHRRLSAPAQRHRRDNPEGDLYLITDNLSSHTSGPIRDWLAAHPRVQQVFIPVGACWLNLIEGWWRLLRRAAFAGQCFADRAEIALATRVATGQLNRRAHPWVWGRPPPPHRQLRRCFVYCL